MTQVSLVPILLWVAALACAGIAILREPRPVLQSFVVDRLLRYLFLFPLGVQGLWAFIGHVFFPQQSAASIGWATSPFEARVAAGIAAACFLLGAGIGHIRDIVTTGNLAPGNAGPIMIADFLTPIAVLALLFFASDRWKPKSAATLALEVELDVARKAMRDYRQALSQLGKG